MVEMGKYGIREFTEGFIVAKQSEYTKLEFLEEINSDEFEHLDTEEYEGERFIEKDILVDYMRYYPKGTEGSEDDFGKGEPVWEMGKNPGKGSIEIWAVQS